MTDLSVVLISKNQAWNVSRLIQSVLEGTSCVSEKEVMLVDSASTDQTVELASRYPISIFRLRPGQRLSPAIGRYVGYERTRGEYVLFLDGDMELLPGWLDCALRFMRSEPRAGIAMSSSVINVSSRCTEDKSVLPEPESFREPKETLRVPFAAGGAALYRRSALEEVGCFNPYLHSEEEPELCLRIRHAGYFVLLFDRPIVRHYDDETISLSRVLGRRGRKFHLGMGQAVRYHIGSKLFWPWLKERWWEPSAALLFVSGLGALAVTLVLREPIWIGLWTLGLSALIAFAALRKRSVREALVAAFNWIIMAEGFWRGLFTKPSRPETFQADVETVKDSGRSIRAYTNPRRNPIVGLRDRGACRP